MELSIGDLIIINPDKYNAISCKDKEDFIKYSYNICSNSFNDIGKIDNLFGIILDMDIITIDDDSYYSGMKLPIVKVLVNNEIFWTNKYVIFKL